jgi:hypothetical protein
MNRRMPNGTYGGVRGRGRKAPAYSIPESDRDISGERDQPELSGSLLPAEGVYRKLWPCYKGLRSFGS